MISPKACACYNQGICDSYTGLCICPSGYLGQQCERLECEIEYFFNDNIFCVFQQRLYVIILFAKIPEFVI